MFKILLDKCFALISVEIFNIILISLKILQNQRCRFVKCQSIKLLQGLPALLSLLCPPNFCVYRLRRTPKQCWNHVVVSSKISLHAICWFGRMILKTEFWVQMSATLSFSFLFSGWIKKNLVFDNLVQYFLSYWFSFPNSFQILPTCYAPILTFSLSHTKRHEKPWGLVCVAQTLLNTRAFSQILLNMHKRNLRKVLLLFKKT